MNDVAGQAVSPKTIERVTHDVGRERAGRRDADPRSDRAMAQAPESPPQLDVVECDGGWLTRHLRTRLECPFTRRPRSPSLSAPGIKS